MSSEKKEIGLSAAQIAGLGNSDIDPSLLIEGFELIRQEKASGFREAFRNHWRAMLWSMTLSIALVMDGYDGAVTGSFFGQPQFLKYFGYKTAKGTYAIDPNMQMGIQYIGIPGGFLGLWICGVCQERYGSRKTYMGGMAAIIAIIFLFVFCQNLGMLLAAQALAATCWAIFNTLTATYSAELCPIQLRGYATSFISMCWGMGSFIASGVNRGALEINSDWAWRSAWAVQWVYPVPLLLVAFFAPESPWWLVRHGKIEEAKRTLLKIASPGYWDSRNVDAYIAVIKHTDELERADQSEGKFRDMWRKGPNMRRTEIMMGVWAIQVWSGTAMTAYAVQFFQDAGMSTVASFNLNIVVTSMNLVGCGIEFFLIRRWGRRPLILLGLGVLAICLLLIGIFGSVPTTTGTLAGIGACCTIINLAYHASVGPLTYTVAAELPPTRLRAKAVAWGRAFYSINYNATAALTPRMVNPASWNWGAKAAYFWLGGNLGVTLWAFFRLPETGGFSFAELDILFSNNVSARKFTKVVIHDEAVEGNDKFVEGGEIEEKEDINFVETAMPQHPTATLT